MMTARWRSRRGLIALALAGALALPGCVTTNPATGRQTVSVIGPEQEAAMGAEEHPKIVAQFGGVYDEDPALTAYVNEIGRRLGHVTETPDQRFTFTILDSDVVNAFALPGGYVYVTRGLVALANSEAELAGVIAHEIGHVVARHTAQRVTQGLLANLGAAVLGAALGSPAVADVAQIGAAAYVQSYSREQEYEADDLGVRYLTRVGYAPEAMAGFLASLQAESALAAKIAGREGGEPEASLFSSHPRTPDRIRRAAQAARASVIGDPIVGRDSYLFHIQNVVYGDSPEQGFVRGRVFVHPELGFRFEVPEGFRLQNSPAAVIATREDGAAIRFDGAKVPAGLSMPRYLASEWLPQARLDDVERITVNGMEAATATAEGSTDSGPVDVRPVAIRFGGDQVYRFLFVSPARATAGLRDAYRRTTYSFRPLDAGEAASYRPKRIRIVEVAQGESPESLARTMAVDDFALERFRVLNGLAPGQPLPAGTLVKIVAE
jgi:predicted Zn-dependent protease